MIRISEHVVSVIEERESPWTCLHIQEQGFKLDPFCLRVGVWGSGFGLWGFGLIASKPLTRTSRRGRACTCRIGV
eukprot:3901760-Rhodomonas_salina.1